VYDGTLTVGGAFGNYGTKSAGGNPADFIGAIFSNGVRSRSSRNSGRSSWNSSCSKPVCSTECSNSCNKGCSSSCSTASSNSCYSRTNHRPSHPNGNGVGSHPNPGIGMPGSGIPYPFRFPKPNRQKPRPLPCSQPSFPCPIRPLEPSQQTPWRRQQKQLNASSQFSSRLDPHHFPIPVARPTIACTFPPHAVGMPIKDIFFKKIRRAVIPQSN
jgi:hypothetical protein